MSDPAEIELKLAVVAGRSHSVARALPAAKFERVALDDLYYDTPDAQLRRRGLVLRVRRDGERWLQTLKSTGRQHNLVSERGEWELELGRGGERPAPNLEPFTATLLQLLKDFDPAALGPVFRSRVVRRRANVTHGVSRVEVALDEGELAARIDGKASRRTIAEAELELKEGRAADVIGLALRLVDRRKPRVCMVPALRSKAERGYALALGGRVATAHASARGFAAVLRAEMCAAEALRAVVRRGLTIVVANADALRDSAKPELVHQTRVALRRVRSAIHLFDCDHNDLSARVAKRLRTLARTLGEARDWDVLLDATLPALSANGKCAGAAWKPVRRGAHRRRKRAAAAAVRAVSSRRYAKLVLALAEWTLTAPPAATPSLADIAAASLDKLANRLFADARGFARITREKRHRVRIRAKRLRYALDLFAVALPERATSDYIDALARLQDALGDLNDASVAVGSISSLTDNRRVRQTLASWHRDSEPRLIETAARQIAALARRTRPWLR